VVLFGSLLLYRALGWFFVPQFASWDVSARFALAHYVRIHCGLPFRADEVRT